MNPYRDISVRVSEQNSTHKHSIITRIKRYFLKRHIKKNKFTNRFERCFYCYHHIPKLRNEYGYGDDLGWDDDYKRIDAHHPICPYVLAVWDRGIYTQVYHDYHSSIRLDYVSYLPIISEHLELARVDEKYVYHTIDENNNRTYYKLGKK